MKLWGFAAISANMNGCQEGRKHQRYAQSASVLPGTIRQFDSVCEMGVFTMEMLKRFYYASQIQNGVLFALWMMLILRAIFG